ncbi:cupin domain-containing protein [Ferrimonas balearica]|uniref:cupin domain-containing protein n=1 Tax=Ferrimonas balearica TaxID=44012 RepID=UPI001C99CA3B|nr:cupin domain-containing protein [Ferrimonas balearica]MBY5993533.1 cupin domain-containing protein [Ferrimonas balearica]
MDRPSLPHPVSTDGDTLGHYLWGSGGEGWHLAKSPQLSVIQERLAPGCQETRHRHARAEQFFYVLAGQATLEVAGTVHTLGPGQGLQVLPGQPHRFGNDSSQPLHCLVISTPPSHGDRTLAEAPA